MQSRFAAVLTGVAISRINPVISPTRAIVAVAARLVPAGAAPSG